MTLAGKTLLILLWVPVAVAGAGGSEPALRPESQDTGDVHGSAGLSLSQVKPNEKIRFWIMLENRTARTLSDVRIAQLDAQGFRWTVLRWNTLQGERRCLPPALPPGARLDQPMKVPATCEPIEPALLPGHRAILEGELFAEGIQPHSSVYAEFSWKDQDGSRGGLMVPLGDVSVADWTSRFSLYEVAKDFALPLLLLIFGLWLRSWEKERAQIGETWSKMLPISHRLATRHYLVIGGALVGILKSDAKMREVSPDLTALEEDEVWLEWSLRQFYYIAFLERQYLHMVHTSGGFYFKNQVGERLVQECLNRFLSLYTKGPPADKLTHLTAVAESLDLKEGFHTFRKRWEAREQLSGEEETQWKRAQMGRAWSDCQDWRRSQDYKKSLQYLGVLLAILGYEINRPYEYWYGERERLLLSPGLRGTLDEIAKEIGETDPAFPAKYEEYLYPSGRLRKGLRRFEELLERMQGEKPT